MAIDFRKLREIPIEKVTRHLGLKLKKNKGRCPCCNRNALKLTPKLNRWWCFGECQAGGDGLELIVRATGLSHVAAAKELQRL